MSVPRLTRAGEVVDDVHAANTAVAVPEFSPKVLGRLGEVEVQHVAVPLDQDAVGIADGGLFASLRPVAEMTGEDLAALARASPHGLGFSVDRDLDKFESFGRGSVEVAYGHEVPSHRGGWVNGQFPEGIQV